MIVGQASRMQKQRQATSENKLEDKDLANSEETDISNAHKSIKRYR